MYETETAKSQPEFTKLSNSNGHEAEDDYIMV